MPGWAGIAWLIFPILLSGSWPRAGIDAYVYFFPRLLSSHKAPDGGCCWLDAGIDCSAGLGSCPSIQSPALFYLICVVFSEFVLFWNHICIWACVNAVFVFKSNCITIVNVFVFVLPNVKPLVAPSNLWLPSLIKLSVSSRSDNWISAKTNRDIGKVQFGCQDLIRRMDGEEEGK